MDIHLDLVGGLAGDMFIAALLDMFPRHEAAVHAAIAALLGGRVESSLTAHRDGALCGRRFDVRLIGGALPSPVPLARTDHAHASWRSIRTQIAGSPLADGVRTRALEIFRLLADAEARVHGTAAEEVSFHEVGAWDSIADIVGAATLIEAIGAARWTASPAPLGSGRLRTAHGILPIPVPATAELLRDMATLDDGIAGERVTPTGAAILRHLCPPGGRITGAAPVRTLTGGGTGFGHRTLPGMSNHVRALCFAPLAGSGDARRTIEVLEFEVDDQSGEDLAAGLDRLRMHEAVLDVTQAPAFGKKGRMMAHVRVLARHGALAEVAAACFQETTTIGLRHRRVAGIALARHIDTVQIDGQSLRVKIVRRQGTTTAKTEADDVTSHAGHARRASVKARAEQAALARAGTFPEPAETDA